MECECRIMFPLFLAERLHVSWFTFVSVFACPPLFFPVPSAASLVPGLHRCVSLCLSEFSKNVFSSHNPPARPPSDLSTLTHVLCVCVCVPQGRGHSAASSAHTEPLRKGT